MGFPQEHCKEALERYDWDEERALNFLLGAWSICVYDNEREW